MSDKAQAMINQLVTACIEFGRQVEPDWQTRIKTAQRELREYIAELEAEIDQLAAHDATERQDDKWIPVSERLPEVYRDETGEHIPFIVCEGDGGHPFVARYNGVNWWAGIFVPDITHWMPMPTLPEVQE